MGSYPPRFRSRTSSSASASESSAISTRTAAPTLLLPSQGLPPHHFGDLAQHRGDYCHRSDSGSLTPQSSCNDVAYRLVRTRFTRQIGHGPIRGSLPRVSWTGPRVTAVSVRVTVRVMVCPRTVPV